MQVQVIGTLGRQLTVQQQALLAAAFTIQGDDLHMYAHITPCINNAAEPRARPLHAQSMPQTSHTVIGNRKYNFTSTTAKVEEGEHGGGEGGKGWGRYRSPMPENCCQPAHLNRVWHTHFLPTAPHKAVRLNGAGAPRHALLHSGRGGGG